MRVEGASMGLFLLSIILIFVGAFLILLSMLPPTRIEGMGIILIGPFPIIFQGEIGSPIILATIILLSIILLFIVAIFGTVRKIAEHGSGRGPEE